MEMADEGGGATTTEACAMDSVAADGSRPALRLRTIVIDNFKNYVGKHTMEIDSEPFVCFFGRNGAGKSCVVDAIAFCLGATPQQLRVKRFAKLVNDIVVARDPVAQASVALCFHTDGQNPIWIRRTVDGASSQSKYQFSDTASIEWKSGSKASMEASLRQHGVDMQLQDRFIIRQANASALAQMSSVQLLHFCERIIGTSHLKDELSEMNKQWSELAAKSDILRDEISGLDKEADGCQPMVNTYQDWIEKTEKVDAARTESTNTLILTNQGLMRIFRKELNQVMRERNEVEDEAITLRLRSELKEAEFSDQSKLIHTHQLHASTATQNLRQLTKTKVKIQNQRDTVLSEQNMLQIRVAHFDREKGEIEKTTRLLEEQSLIDATNAAACHEALENAKIAVASLADSATADLETEKATQQLLKDIEQAEATLRQAKSTQTNQAKAKARTSQLLDRLQLDVAQVEASKSEIQSVLQQLNSSLQQDSETLAAHSSAKERMRIEVAKLEADFMLYSRRFAKTTSTSKGDAIIQRFQESLGQNVVHGRLWELATAEAKFAGAVNSALQAQLSHVVVADRRTGVCVSKAFTNEAAGGVSCFVLEEFDSSLACSRTGCGRWCDETPDDQGFGDEPIPLCQALVCSDTRVKRIFHKYARNWVIVTDNDEAETVVKRSGKNCVTLQGDLFYVDGSIRASSTTNSVRQSFSNGRIRSTGTATVVQSARRDQPANPDKSDQRLSTALEEAKDNLCKLNGQIEELSQQIDTKTGEKERLAVQWDEAESALKRLKAKREIAEHERDHAHSESTMTPLKCYTDRLSTLRKSRAKILQSAASKKRASLFSEQARCEKELGSVKARLELSKANLAKLRIKNRTLSQQQVAFHAKIDQLDEQAQSFEGHVAEIDRDLQVAVDEGEKAKKALAEAKAVSNILASEKRELEDAIRKNRSGVKRLLDCEHRIVEKISAIEVELEQLCGDSSKLDDPMEIGSAESLHNDRRRLLSMLEDLKNEQHVLDSIQSKISIDQVQRAIKCEEELVQLREQLQQIKTSLASLSARQHDLTRERHKRLVESLGVINAHFSRIYRLMNEDGDCYLGYSMEKSTLFAEGVTLNCKPDESHWQSFLGLSGGQQVVCAVSLMLALQASFPNPFYVCDEIDAALDTLNVKKLAELLLDQSHRSNTQFLVVSHRPEMWEVGSYLIGVYESENSARTISCRFE